MKKSALSILFACACLFITPGCGGPTETTVISSDADALADLEAQMNADEEAANAEMQAGIEE